METKDKTIFIKMIDHYVGIADMDKLDEALLFLYKGEHLFDIKFVKFVLSYTMIYDRELKNWKQLKEKFVN